MRIRVLLTDGRKILREGLCALLERHSDIRVVGEAEDGQAAVKLAAALTPDVAILSVTASTHGFKELIQNLRAANPSLHVIVLTLSPNATFLREMLEAGAEGCLTKECASADLVTAIRSVAANKVYLSPKIAEALVSGYVLPRTRGEKPASLSAREKLILQRIADGQSTKQIAGAFGVSAKTIETHRRRIMQKLGKHTVAGLTKYAVREGITSFD